MSDVVLIFFRLEKMRPETISLELAKGRIRNEIKNEGMVVAVEKLSTVSTRGSANTAATIVPRSIIIKAFMVFHLGFFMLPVASSL